MPPSEKSSPHRIPKAIELTGLDKKVFGTLFFSIFAAVTGVGIVVPLLPVYAHDLGASGLYIGLIFGAFSLSRTLFLPLFGRLSDKKGRKPFIATGLLAYAFISVAFVFSRNVPTLIGIRFIQGIASAMIMPVAQAYVGDIAPSGEEGFTMGMFNMSIFLSLSIGPLLGGYIKDRWGLHAAFVIMGALAMGAFLMSFLLLPPSRMEAIRPFDKRLAGWGRLLKDPELAGLLSFRFSYTACIGVIWGFLPVYAASVFSISSSLIGVLVMLGVLISGLIQTPMGYVADRISRKKMIVVGGGISSLGLLLFQFAGGFWDLFSANFLFGLGGGIAMPPLMATAVLKGNQVKAMGAVMALLTMAHSGGMLVGSILAGVTMDFFQLRQAFLVGAGLMIAGAGLFSMLAAPRKGKTGRPRSPSTRA